MSTTVVAEAGTAHRTREVTEDDVRMAYRLLLGREPESEAAVRDKLSLGQNLSDLRRAFLTSAEFKAKLKHVPATPASKPMDWPPIPVEADVSSEVLQRMMQHIEANWQILGENEPHWSVLTADAFKAANLAENLGAFYASGQRTFSYFQAAAARCGVVLSKNGSCFELGCGVGRVTLALSEAFARVIGGDISKSHLKIAKDVTFQAKRTNVEYVHIKSLETITALPNFDYFFSVIVLQHNPPPVIKSLLKKILSKLNREGVAYFQVPTYSVNYAFRSEPYISNASSEGKMEVHVLPQPEIYGILKECGCELLEVREDNWTGSPHFISNSFLVKRR